MDGYSPPSTTYCALATLSIHAVVLEKPMHHSSGGFGFISNIFTVAFHDTDIIVVPNRSRRVGSEIASPVAG